MVSKMKESEMLKINELEMNLVPNEAVRLDRRLLNIEHDTIHRNQYTIWNGKKWTRIKRANLPSWSTQFTEHTKHFFDYDRTVIFTKPKE